MDNAFQLIYPGMHPAVLGIFELFLFLITGIGCLFIYLGIRRILVKKKSTVTILFLVFGLAVISYPAMNWRTYHLIYSANEKKIIGNFYAEGSTSSLKINADHTWTYNGNEIPCERGTWEYITSEDWCYWNIQSEEKYTCFVQTGDPEIIQFKGKWFAFKKKTVNSAASQN